MIYKDGDVLPGKRIRKAVKAELWQSGLKRCCKCHKIKPLTEFNRKAGTKDGLRFDCAQCNAEDVARWIHKGVIHASS